MNPEAGRYVSVIVGLSEPEIHALENLETSNIHATAALDKICDEARFMSTLESEEMEVSE